VFENRVLRIFVPKREEVTGWRKLRNDERNSLICTLQTNIVVIRSGMVRWSGHVARMGDV
jgi:hypothetical protein